MKRELKYNNVASSYKSSCLDTGGEIMEQVQTRTFEESPFKFNEGDTVDFRHFKQCTVAMHFKGQESITGALISPNRYRIKTEHGNQLAYEYELTNKNR